MKKLSLIPLFGIIVMGLVACNVEESQELADYHNDYIEEVNPIAEEIDEKLVSFWDVDEPEEALNYFEEDIQPLIDDIGDFIESREPDAEVVQELHELRQDQLSSWFEGFDLLLEGLEEAIASGDEDAVLVALEESDGKFLEAQEKAEKADDRFLEMADEYDVEFEDE